MSAVLFPWDSLRERGFDEAFAVEVEAVRWSDLSAFSVDHDSLSERVRLWNAPADPGLVLYRGWMVSVAQYEVLHKGLADRGFSMFTSPAQYAAAHQIDGWVELFKNLTFKTVLLGLSPSDEEIVAAGESLGVEEFFVKDFVKSVKTGAGFEPITVSNLVQSVRDFASERGDWLSGGIVLREFVSLPDERTEMRGWWREGVWRAVTVHPDFAGSVPVEVPVSFLDEVDEKLRELGIHFVSVDFVQLADGRWKVIEIGDGQVSGLPLGVSDETVLAILG